VLATPRRRIAEVSDALGFPHQRHFATVFRTSVAMTPRAYQRQRSGKKKARFRKYRTNW
jgi:AraC-like DNA-binding protein